MIFTLGFSRCYVLVQLNSNIMNQQRLNLWPRVAFSLDRYTRMPQLEASDSY